MANPTRMVPSYGNNLPYTGGSYNQPNINRSSVDAGTNSVQLSNYDFDRNAILQAKRKLVFTNVAPSRMISKNSGKELKCYFIPRLLDDRNRNFQGLDPQGVYYEKGNFYGFSQDISTILSRMPFLGEVPGQVNRVGSSRIVLSGRVTRFGFYMEMTEEALNFDTDPTLYSRYTQQMHEAAAEIYEDMLTIDLLNSPALQVIAGSNGVTDISAMTAANVLSYSTLEIASLLLDKMEVAYDSDFQFGTTRFDTKTVSNARIAYTHPAVINLLKRMKGPLGEPAFIPAQRYGAEQHLPDEYGMVDQFRFIRVQRMPAHTAATSPTIDYDKQPYLKPYQKLATKPTVPVYPIIVFGKDSFATVGVTDLATGSSKFKLLSVPPGKEATLADVYASRGFISIQWYYGFMTLRSDQMLVIWTAIGTPPDESGAGAVKLEDIMKKVDDLYNAYVGGAGLTSDEALEIFTIGDPITNPPEFDQYPAEMALNRKAFGDVHAADVTEGVPVMKRGEGNKTEPTPPDPEGKSTASLAKKK